MKGILLAGGSGSRLYPSTVAVSKQLLPVYDKPTIYYPLSTLMLAGVREVLIISTPRDLPLIRQLLGSGEKLGMQFSYAQQEKPNGIPEAFIIGKSFLNGGPGGLILGDNIFYGHDVERLVAQAAQRGAKDGATVFAYHVHDPERYGVVEFDSAGKAISLEEKPQKPKSNWAMTGLYFYDSRVCDFASELKPSRRGELEIVDLTRKYLELGELRVESFNRGIAWLDTGTHDSLVASSQFVQTIEHRQGLKIACLEEIALLKKFISLEAFVKLAEESPASSYGVYLKNLAKQFVAT